MPLGHKKTKVLAHRGGKAHGRENDAETIKRVLAFKPDIIEIDVRKSKDGILYCYHGSVPLGFAAALFLYRLEFSRIQRLIGRRDTLETILEVIPQETTVLLDLKDSRILAEDLAPFIRARENVWIETATHKHMQALSFAFEEVDFVFNRPLFFARYVLPMVLGLSNTVEFSINGERERLFAYRDLSKIQ